jgi:hypothetical protein
MSVMAIGQGWGSRSNNAKVFFILMTKFVSRPVAGTLPATIKSMLVIKNRREICDS